VPGSPRLGVLRRLRPTRPFSGRRAYPRPSGWTPATRELATGGSRVHCDPLSGLGARLYPGGLATATPQTFTVASRDDQMKTPPGSSRRNGTQRDAPHPARIHQI